jgi:hypothetical protein
MFFLIIGVFMALTTTLYQYSTELIGWPSAAELPSNRSHIADPMKDQLFHLIGKGCSIKEATMLFKKEQEGEKYGIYRTAIGLVIQKEDDYIGRRQTGYFLSSEGEVKFDGDQNCRVVASEFFSFEEKLKAIARSLKETDSSQQLDAEFRLRKAQNGMMIESTKDQEHFLFVNEHGITVLKDDPKQTMLNTILKTILVSSLGVICFKEPLKREQECQKFFACYFSGYRPNSNLTNLLDYIASPAFANDAATVKVYFNGDQLSCKDAVQVVHRREPVNIGMQQMYNQKAFYTLIEQMQKQGRGVIPHKVSAYNETDQTFLKEDGTRFSTLPNTACLYSETPLWKKPGDENSRIQVACLSLPAPALDKKKQPHFGYYIVEGKLNMAKYQQEMRFLAATVIQSLLDNKDKAFSGQGIQRLVISRYGQQAFLEKVSAEDRSVANKIFYDSLVEQISNCKEKLKEIEICMSEYTVSMNAEIEENFVSKLATDLWVGIVNGDILANARQGDLIINAWDPHSFPGNGNEGDRSFDGKMGEGTAIHLVQNPLMNPYLEINKEEHPLSPERWVTLRVA